MSLTVATFTISSAVKSCQVLLRVLPHVIDQPATRAFGVDLLSTSQLLCRGSSCAPAGTTPRTAPVTYAFTNGVLPALGSNFLKTTQTRIETWPALPGITDKAFMEACVRVHNDLRAKVQPAASNMRYMTWDAALARTARAWANKCVFEHNVHLHKKHQCHPNFTSIGENIWVGSRQAFYVADAIKSWYNEGRFYTFAVHKCTKLCGHYIQVVWDYSYKIGCAVTLCKEVAGIQNAANFVCNYSPGFYTIGRKSKLEKLNALLHLKSHV
ncbi:glioma pathogenesis-related protein 1 [Egretta garzetta]|uniref:glioma pathogenesis-related protein 1 n=1 Tax=Egretta garzetta TaxID=188379 RepID=UPI00163B95FB|nr:glioma pathogenesis-related protein 1 [Egretta garzetta]